MADLPLSGGCGCGAVRFELSARPTVAMYCHCTRCQKRTGGGASVSARVPDGSVTVTEGAGLLGGWTLATGMTKAFCTRCGSHLFASDRDSGAIRAVRMSAFDADPELRPSARQFVADAVSWESIPDDGLPRFDGAAS